jgi:DNA-binding NarL/FixJ family response regulator
MAKAEQRRILSVFCSGIDSSGGQPLSPRVTAEVLTPWLKRDEGSNKVICDFSDGGRCTAALKDAPETSLVALPVCSWERKLDLPSGREVEVLRFAGQGLDNAAIGRRLFIAEGTVEKHAKSAYTKLGIDNGTAGRGKRPPAVIKAIDEGYLSLEELTEGVDVSPISTLSPSELAVVVALADGGLTNEQIGARLYVTEGTVEKHINHALDKTQFPNRTALAVRYMAAEQQGMVEKLQEERQAVKLTEREVEVLRLAGQGLDNATIGERLYITEGTVEQHAKSTYVKLGIDKGNGSRRTPAVIKAIDEGYLSLDELIDGVDISRIRDLSERELEIVALLTDYSEGGLTRKQMSTRLFVTKGTVWKHINTALAKTQAPNTTVLAVMYMAAEQQGSEKEQADTLIESEAKVRHLDRQGLDNETIGQGLFVAEVSERTEELGKQDEPEAAQQESIDPSANFFFEETDGFNLMGDLDTDNEYPVYSEPALEDQRNDVEEKSGYEDIE